MRKSVFLFASLIIILSCAVKTESAKEVIDSFTGSNVLIEFSLDLDKVDGCNQLSNQLSDFTRRD